jgi:hypothetical protein
MCDYSLHHVDSRLARVGDKLISRSFTGSVTRGFTTVNEPDVAVCLLPGTELAFKDKHVDHYKVWTLFGTARVKQNVARFRQVNLDHPDMHHDALEFPNGQIVMVTKLCEDQQLTVLQMPAASVPEGASKEQDVPAHVN